MDIIVATLVPLPWLAGGVLLKAFAATGIWAMIGRISLWMGLVCAFGVVVELARHDVQGRTIALVSSLTALVVAAFVIG